jgi:hypothetical protein
MEWLAEPWSFQGGFLPKRNNDMPGMLVTEKEDL